MTIRRLAVLLAAALLAASIAVGAWPHTAHGQVRAVTCGSVLRHATSVPLPADAPSLVRQFAAQDLHRCAAALAGPEVAARWLAIGAAAFTIGAAAFALTLLPSPTSRRGTR